MGTRVFVDTFFALGLTSGTSRAGIDLALLETDGHAIVRRLAFEHFPYSDQHRALLADACAAALARKLPEHCDLTAAADRLVTTLQVDMIRAFLRERDMKPEQIDVIGMSGHTIAHRPEFKWTWQIGNGQTMASSLGITVVDQFAQGDMKAGGQGGPIVPVYLRALTTSLERPLAFLDLGGIARLTWIGRDGQLLAFDAGVGNALIDDWMLRHYGEPFDRGGTRALQGRVIKMIFEDMTRDPWFERPPPKTLDREHFTAARIDWMDPLDGVATLTAFAAASIALALPHLPEPPRAWLATGGGRHNQTLLAMIEAGSGVPVRPVEDLGLSGDTIDAEAMAYIAVRAMKYDPIFFPGTSGVDTEMSGGTIRRA